MTSALYAIVGTPIRETDKVRAWVSEHGGTVIHEKTVQDRQGGIRTRLFVLMDDRLWILDPFGPSKTYTWTNCGAWSACKANFMRKEIY